MAYTAHGQIFGCQLDTDTLYQRGWEGLSSGTQRENPAGGDGQSMSLRVDRSQFKSTLGCPFWLTLPSYLISLSFSFPICKRSAPSLFKVPGIQYLLSTHNRGIHEYMGKELLQRLVCHEEVSQEVSSNGVGVS